MSGSLPCRRALIGAAVLSVWMVAFATPAPAWAGPAAHSRSAGHGVPHGDASEAPRDPVDVALSNGIVEDGDPINALRAAHVGRRNGVANAGVMNPGDVTDDDGPPSIVLTSAWIPVAAWARLVWAGALIEGVCA